MHRPVRQRGVLKTAVSQSDQPQSGRSHRGIPVHVGRQQRRRRPGDDVDCTPSANATAAVTTAAATATPQRDMCEVCLIAPRSGVALVPGGHSRFCSNCAEAVADMPDGFVICRTSIRRVLHVFVWMKRRLRMLCLSVVFVICGFARTLLAPTKTISFLFRVLMYAAH